MNASAHSAPPALRILLLEDDPVSAAFLAESLAGLPARVDRAATLAEARESCAGQDVWLFDANLPDGSGEALLAELRARGLQTVALAHTADPRRETRDALIRAGFAEVLHKPIGVVELREAIARVLGDAHIEANLGAAVPARECAQASASSPAFADARSEAISEGPRTDAASIWNDADALRALNGNPSHVRTMRELFLSELPTTQARIAAAFANQDQDRIRAETHKLQAACGFVGAARVLSTLHAIREAPLSAEAYARFERAIVETLAAAHS